MKDAFGALHWTPAVFWSATLTEFFCAIDGFNAMNGSKPKQDGPTDSEMAELLAKYG